MDKYLMVLGPALDFHADSHHPKGVDSLTNSYAVVNSGIPVGCIILWSGATTAIPQHWNICDGTNDTPDLRDRFVVGAGSTYAVDATGGSAAFTHSSGGAHIHAAHGTETVSASGAVERNPVDASLTHDSQGAHTHDVHSLPPYYA